MSQEELDDMFGDDPEPIESLSGYEGDDGDEIDPEDIPDPDPLPDALTSPEEEYEDEYEEDAGRGKIIAIALVIVLFVLFGGLFFGRGMIVSMIPAMGQVYDMIGLSGGTLGEGLDIRNVKSERVLENDVDVLVVRGVVNNVSDKPRSVPRIRVALYNSNGEEVLFVITDPQKKELAPGGDTGFKTRLEDPPATARRLEVTFIETANHDLAADGGAKSEQPPSSEHAPPAE